jgi:hypothetical protein
MDYGWSAERTETVDGAERGVFCITEGDRRRLYHYIYLLEFGAGR